MLEASDLGLKFSEQWLEEHKQHFLSQLMLFEVTRSGVQVLYDGGGFSDRHETMKNAVNKLFDAKLLNLGKKFYIFTGDNRPGLIEFDHAYFSTAGPRVSQHLIVPDPYNFSWKYIGANSYDEFRVQIFENSKKYEESDSIINQAFWRGSLEEHPVRKDLFEAVSNEQLFNVSEARQGDSSFESLTECGKYSTLIDLPGRGYSARLKYLIASARPVIVFPRETWDWASFKLEPGIHYIPTLPILDEFVAKCSIAVENEDIRKYYANNIKSILYYLGEEYAMLSLAHTINTQSE
jgi:hypothetical protein